MTTGKLTVWSHLSEAPRVVKFIDTESRVVGARAWGRWWELVCNGGRVSVVGERRVLEMEGGLDCTAASVCVMLLNGALTSG